jgi:type VI secretion system protein ImpK
VLTRLKNTYAHTDPEGLRNQLAAEIRGFEQSALSLGVDAETMRAASYVLRTALDEVVLCHTTWGPDSVWRREGLGDALGGERFFEGLEGLLTEPARHLHLLELMYICLSLGFEGRYRGKEGGREQLAALRERVYQAIRTIRGEHERELSPHWQPVSGLKDPHSYPIPVWVVAGLAGAILIAVYWVLSYRLDGASDPTFKELFGVARDLPMPTRDAPIPPPPPQPTVLRKFLEPEIQKGLVEVIEKGGRSKIRILSRDLFRSGSADISPSYNPLLERIAQALGEVPGPVLVTGHTDSDPIFTPHFRSNWRLSEVRAKAVLKQLSASTGTPHRFSAKGLADTEPLVPNDSPENKARNRRVEIILLRGRAP